jgi:predicted HicB family RNase H-like nuclease
VRSASISTVKPFVYKDEMKKPKPEKREIAMNVRVRPSVKAAAERLAHADGRSLANWLERLIEAEVARQDAKK